MDQWWSNCMSLSYYRTEKHQSRYTDDFGEFKRGDWLECNTVAQSIHATLPQVYCLNWSQWECQSIPRKLVTLRHPCTDNTNRR